MFAIHTPQTIQLDGPPNEDGSPGEPLGSVTFQHAHDDVSECQMVLASKGRTWTYNFNTRGAMIDMAYEDDDTRAAKAAAEEQARKDAEEAAAVEQADNEPVNENA